MGPWNFLLWKIIYSHALKEREPQRCVFDIGVKTILNFFCLMYLFFPEYRAHSSVLDVMIVYISKYLLEYGITKLGNDSKMRTVWGWPWFDTQISLRLIFYPNNNANLRARSREEVAVYPCLSPCYSWKNRKAHQCSKVYVAQVSRGVWNWEIGTFRVC